jgi:hypothetical protein
LKTSSNFDKYYVERSRTNLEVEAINAYLKDHNAQHIPVDIDQMPPEAFFRDYRRAIERVEGLIDSDGFNYRCLIDASKRSAADYGFRFLNSQHYQRYIKDLRETIEAGLQTINDSTLSQAYRSWNEFNDQRENAILQNIYSFSREHSFKTAVLLLGAAHRTSMTEKIQHWKDKEELLNWEIYGS